jgi:hypothetical protein
MLQFSLNKTKIITLISQEEHCSSLQNLMFHFEENAFLSYTFQNTTSRYFPDCSIEKSSTMEWLLNYFKRVYGSIEQGPTMRVFDPHFLLYGTKEHGWKLRNPNFQLRLLYSSIVIKETWNTAHEILEKYKIVCSVFYSTLNIDRETRKQKWGTVIFTWFFVIFFQ